MKKSLLIPLLIVVGICLNQSAFSLPRFSLATGAKCGYCHTNPTGGQLRNDNGVSYSIETLPIAAHKEDDFLLNPKLTDNIRVGADFRTQFLYDMGMDPNDSVKGKSSFHAMTATVYGSVTLSKKVSVFFKQDLLGTNYGAYSGPEIYGVAKILPQGGYIKAGLFMPDYGWRIDDHTSYTRGGDIGFFPAGSFTQGLFFTPDYKDIGIEAGVNVDAFSLTASILNGTGDRRKISFSKDKAYTAKLEYMNTTGDDGVNYRLGVSGYWFKEYSMGGFHAGLSYGDFVLLCEMDFTHQQLTNPLASFAGTPNVSAAFIEVDYRAMQGLWLTAKYDAFDPLNGVSDDDLTPTTNTVKKLIFGLEFFPYSFVELRPQYRHLVESPSSENDQFLVQLHLWF